MKPGNKLFITPSPTRTTLKQKEEITNVNQEEDSKPENNKYMGAAYKQENLLDPSVQRTVKKVTAQHLPQINQQGNKQKFVDVVPDNRGILNKLLLPDMYINKFPELGSYISPPSKNKNANFSHFRSQSRQYKLDIQKNVQQTAHDNSNQHSNVPQIKLNRNTSRFSQMENREFPPSKVMKIPGKQNIQQITKPSENVKFDPLFLNAPFDRNQNRQSSQIIHNESSKRQGSNIRNLEPINRPPAINIISPKSHPDNVQRNNISMSEEMKSDSKQQPISSPNNKETNSGVYQQLQVQIKDAIDKIKDESIDPVKITDDDIQTALPFLDKMSLNVYAYAKGVADKNRSILYRKVADGYEILLKPVKWSSGNPLHIEGGNKKVKTDCIKLKFNNDKEFISATRYVTTSSAPKEKDIKKSNYATFMKTSLKEDKFEEINFQDSNGSNRTIFLQEWKGDPIHKYIDKGLTDPQKESLEKQILLKFDIKHNDIKLQNMVIKNQNRELELNYIDYTAHGVTHVPKSYKYYDTNNPYNATNFNQQLKDPKSKILGLAFALHELWVPKESIVVKNALRPPQTEDENQKRSSEIYPIFSKYSATLKLAYKGDEDWPTIKVKLHEAAGIPPPSHAKTENIAHQKNSKSLEEYKTDIKNKTQAAKKLTKRLDNVINNSITEESDSNNVTLTAFTYNNNKHYIGIKNIDHIHERNELLKYLDLVEKGIAALKNALVAEGWV